MTDSTSFLASLREAEAASKAARMGRLEKIGYLKRSGWQNPSNNWWRSRDGRYAVFGDAVVAQLIADAKKQ